MSKKILLLAVLVMGIVAIPVISIVGGALFATTQETCTQTTSGFTGEDLVVENFDLNDQGQMQIELRNGAASTVELESITIYGQSEDLSESIGIGQASVVEITQINLDTSDSCNEVPVEFTYTSEGTQQSVSGVFMGEIQTQ
ncbi:MAG: hypothetical protein R6V35_00505 [Candidatus Nanohaloarchaea archaeon]